MYPMMNQLHHPMGMRRYQIQEAIFSLGDNFYIRDEYGQGIFMVRSQLFTIEDKLLLEDMAGNALIKIQQKLLNFSPTYRLFSAFPADINRPLGVVRQQLAFFQKRFIIESVYGEYRLESLDIFAHAFTLFKYGRIVATVGKHLFSYSDSYSVEIVADEDHAFILALVIVLDQVIYDRDKQMYDD